MVLFIGFTRRLLEDEPDVGESLLRNLKLENVEGDGENAIKTELDSKTFCFAKSGEAGSSGRVKKMDSKHAQGSATENVVRNFGRLVRRQI